MTMSETPCDCVCCRHPVHRPATVSVADIVSTAPLAGGAEFTSREEAMEEAVRLWELGGRIGTPCIHHLIGKWDTPRYQAGVIEVGPTR